MTNLEYLFRNDARIDFPEKSIIIHLNEEEINEIKSTLKNGLCFDTIWLLQECQEPVKLKQWEYDLIKTNDMSHGRPFISFAIYKHMLDKGYFKGVYDTNMSLKQILNNCEVIE